MAYGQVDSQICTHYTFLLNMNGIINLILRLII